MITKLYIIVTALIFTVSCQATQCNESFVLVQDVCLNATIIDGVWQNTSCTFSCQCPEGHFVLDNKLCADPMCKANEEFVRCTNCTEETCFTGQACISECGKWSCQCKAGYVRHQGVCILKSSCPEPCGRNEVYDNCGTACEPKCTDSAEAIRSCIPVCQRQGACRCANGYYRNQTGFCVTQPECVVCGINEELKTCGACDGTCAVNSPVCPLVCRPAACGCKNGFVRERGVCIRKESCPKPQCGPNEVFNGIRCVCKSGFVKNSIGICVSRQPTNRCTRRNEKFFDCTSDCERTCGRQPYCSHRLRYNVCQCRRGYVRHHSGACVDPCDC